MDFFVQHDFRYTSEDSLIENTEINYWVKKERAVKSYFCFFQTKNAQDANIFKRVIGCK